MLNVLSAVTGTACQLTNTQPPTEMALTKVGAISVSELIWCVNSPCHEHLSLDSG